MSATKQKYLLGRKVREEKTITRGPNVEFGALYEATEILMELHMRVGWMDGDNPMGFTDKPLNDTFSYIPKWSLLSGDDKQKLMGVLVSSNYRKDSVKIIFFDNE